VGFLIDSKLTFKYHLNLVESKFSRVVEILYKVTAVLPREALLKTLLCFCSPSLTYCMA